MKANHKETFKGIARVTQLPIQLFRSVHTLEWVRREFPHRPVADAVRCSMAPSVTEQFQSSKECAEVARKLEELANENEALEDSNLELAQQISSLTDQVNRCSLQQPSCLVDQYPHSAS